MSETTLHFHPEFNQKSPGDVILQDDDRKRCFYFRLGLLKELSSFFGTLPEPSAADLVDGTPLIPLHGTTTAGLVTFLHAINSITEILPLTLHGSSRGAAGIIGAAHIGKMYDVPIVYRILIEALSPVRRAHLVELAIWVISNESSKT